MKQEKWITAIICILVIAIAGFYYLYTDQRQDQPKQDMAFHTEDPLAASAQHSDSSGQQTSQPDPSEEYAVYICGAVKHPGVYRFSKTARVCDVIEAAGGFTDQAATASVNQARYITDGEQIEIVSQKQWKKSQQQAQKSSPEGNESAAGENGKININTATEAELMTLPGVGQSKAKAIMDYRTQNGFFQNVEDIMQVPGIKEGVFNQIKDSVTV